MRWYHKVAIELIQGTAVVNAMHLYNERCKQANQPVMQIATFREKLVISLLNIDGSHQFAEDVRIKNYLRETEEREKADVATDESVVSASVVTVLCRRWAAGS
jgi:thymidylate synthase